MERVEEVCTVCVCVGVGGGSRERRLSSGTGGPLLAVEAGDTQVPTAGPERAPRLGVGSSSSECSQPAGLLSEVPGCFEETSSRQKLWLRAEGPGGRLDR